MDYQRITREILRLTRETQGELAERLGVSQASVSRWVNGKEVEANNRDLIQKEAKRLGIINRKSGAPVTSVQIVGYVGAGGTIDFEQGQGPHGEAALPPSGTTPSMVAVEVRGDSMSGALESGWLVYYDDRRDPPEDDLIGKLCVIGLSDGRVLIKRLYRGRKAKHFDLLSSNSPPLHDQPVTWAAKVVWIAPK